MPGRIRVRFEREPDYFAGCPPGTQVMVARDDERVVAVACRSVLKLFVNGVPEDVGYLGQLRVDRSYRGQLLTARGFRVMRDWHADGRARSYFTTIVDGNAQAEGVLVRKARGGMPRYRFLERLYTLAVSVRGAQAPASASAPSGPYDQPPIEAPNLFPCYEPAGELVSVEGGCAALLDQRHCKQTVIDGYDGALRLVRPLYNLVGRIRLPAANTRLDHAYVTHFRAAGTAAAKKLIKAVRSRAAVLGFDHVLFAFTASDPLLAVARTFKPVEYVSSIYTVAFDDGDDFHDRLLARPRALDLSAL
jgi:hypothetical protein